MNFDSYIVKNIEIAQIASLKRLQPHTQKSLSNKNFRLFRRHAKRAFTLAETLITLTIIGVIAALTIPNLISKIQDHGFKSAFIKTYGVIREASNLAEREGESFWDINDGFMSPYYYRTNPNAMKNYFKIARGPFVHTGGGGHTAFTKVYGNNFNFANDVKLLNGQQNGGYLLLSNGSAMTFQLEDSTIVGFTLSHGLVRMMVVDVNGAKKPNQWGRDVFALQGIYQNGQFTVLPFGAKGSGSVWGQAGNDCIEGGNGTTCGYYILKDRSFNPPYQ